MFKSHPAVLVHKARSRFLRALIFGALVSAATANQQARADTFTTGNIAMHAFYVSAENLYVRPGEIVSFDHVQDMGGDIRGVLNGSLLAGTYCVNITDPVYLNSAYNATTVSADGKVFGESIQNAGKISWLLQNYATAATTNDLQNALQAAIWRTEYGSGFQVDGVDNAKTGNTTAMKSAYSMYLQNLGNNVASVGDVLWISPIVAASQGTKPPASSTSHYQGLVGVRAAGTSSPVPEPGVLGLLLTGSLPLMGAVKRRKA